MNSLRCGVVTALAVLSTGCPQDPGVAGRPKVVPAGGRVLLKGQPVEGAVVTFNNLTANVSGYATTGPDGRFTLTTFAAGDGAAPGKCLVSVRKVDVIDRAKPGFDYAASSETPPPPEEKWHVPQKYSAFNTSGLAVEVSEAGPNDFNLDLKD